MDSGLILPGTLEFYLECQNIPPPPGWQEEVNRTGGAVALVAPVGQCGLMEVVPLSRAAEYMHDGELDQRQDEIEELDGAIDLWIPGS